ncbi:hypothetical protein UCRPC4_g00435 [Phaeomoniella chlamydospora]|uniref:Uncharacterized protein n=1 Tax=Phaeomoniella chlamydospora TaxID=158046 RepID=A0A0G2F2U6_PHACM|nr:hypothetical protein UCRPC4_g00435 [Phaeomoniella chlamydospora]
MSRYLPPHLREQNVSTASTESTVDGPSEASTRRTLSELQLDATSPNKIQGPKANGDSGQDQPLHTIDEIHTHYHNEQGSHTTLNESPTTSGKLAYIILFRNANPRWQSGRTIYAKTNIHLLPGYDKYFKDDDSSSSSKGKNHEDRTTNLDIDRGQHEDGNSSIRSTCQHSPPIDDQEKKSPTNNGPIPVFLEVTKKRQTRKFLYYGYWDLAKIDFLKPRSPGLVRMLQQKWSGHISNQTRKSEWRPSSANTPKERNPEAWEKSLGQKWAVIKLRKVTKAEDGSELKDPDIQELDAEEEQGLGKEVEVSNHDNRYEAIPDQTDTTAAQDQSDEVDLIADMTEPCDVTD